MLIIDTLYIWRYEGLVWHPLISRYSYSTRKSTSGCANATVPRTTFITPWRKCSTVFTSVTTGSTSIVLPPSEYLYISRCCSISPRETNNIENFLWKVSISNCFLDKRMLEAEVWGTVNVICSPVAVASMWLPTSCGKMW